MKQALKMMSVGAIALVMMLGFAACCENPNTPAEFKGNASILAEDEDHTDHVFSTGATLKKVGDYKYEINGEITKANQAAIDYWWIDSTGPESDQATQEKNPLVAQNDGQRDEYILVLYLPNDSNVALDADNVSVKKTAAYYIKDVDGVGSFDGYVVGKSGLSADSDDAAWAIGLDDALAEDATATQKTFKAEFDYDGDGTVDLTYEFTVNATKAPIVA